MNILPDIFIFSNIPGIFPTILNCNANNTINYYYLLEIIDQPSITRDAIDPFVFWYRSGAFWFDISLQRHWTVVCD